ncbi:hypothetical protein A2704_05040 [Candidatus Kaiserbacteria bacterium RIFCSPHIGHO2_01_FULL_54_36b]|uniref:Methyltransferase FkbM domain-containing protein n=1 Tax=Candidatus Kaiserbacteria bacterium RIFCSPHIGHO2_01_FULL_54_36b TaxID=1798483 RepID=A0A1F6CN88_9BACT|nr:MAG: hypothetical protein A2704_05040 [Candidatus Kaiserbacteria bacterium RIFCSPHIGHO2_01_FULL_54_36b]
MIESLLYPFLKRYGYSKRNKTEPKLWFKAFLSLYFSHIPDDFFLVQIGANDGLRGDPLHDAIMQHNPKGILVEPIPSMFEALQETYKDRAVQLVQLAIAKTPMPLYIGTAPSGVSNAGFDERVIQKWMATKFPNGGKEAYLREHPITKQEVPTRTFMEFAHEYGISRMDLLQIDCEGYDYEILKQVDFEYFTPTLVNYESRHLSEQDAKAARELLEHKGYMVFTHGSDTSGLKLQ